jgi:hypothetical protein
MHVWRWKLAICLTAVTMPRWASAADEGAKDQPGESEAGGDDAEAGGLAKAVQNPVADLISVPLQNNTSYNIGPNERAQNTLNIQPVIPLHLSESLMLITRTILPIIYQPDVTSTGGGTSGVGDINPAFFFSPANPGKLIYGAGPIFSLPTATQRATGSGKWCVGPAAVVLVQPGHWTIGALASQVWSFAGPNDRSSVSFLSVQYFVNYNLAHGWYLSSAPIITADFESPGGDQWTIPFGGGVGKIFKLGKLPFNGTVQAYKNVRPNDGHTVASWQLRIQLALLLPTSKAKEKPQTEPGEASAASPRPLSLRPITAQGSTGGGR